MDNGTNIQEMKDAIKKFCEDRDWDQYHNAKDLAIGIITESSELLEHFRFKSQPEIESLFRNHETREKISEEMADVLYFLLRLSQRYGIDISTAFREKMAKNEAKYPVDKIKGLNKKYDEI